MVHELKSNYDIGDTVFYFDDSGELVEGKIYVVRFAVTKDSIIVSYKTESDDEALEEWFHKTRFEAVLHRYGPFPDQKPILIDKNP